jgi:hypothetical protein
MQKQSKISEYKLPTLSVELRKAIYYVEFPQKWGTTGEFILFF